MSTVVKELLNHYHNIHRAAREMFWWNDYSKLIDEEDAYGLKMFGKLNECEVAVVPGKFRFGLQPNHFALLQSAFLCSTNTIVIVAMNSNKSLVEYHGAHEGSMYSDQDRVEMASANMFVDFVALFDERTPKELCEKLGPEYLVKGHDWMGREDEMPELEFCAHEVFVQQEKPYHTSDIWKNQEENMK